MKKKFSLLLSQLPVVVGSIFFGNKIKPITVFGLALLYEVLCFLIFFGAKIWKELEPSLVKATADKLRVAFLNIFSGFRRRYKRQIYYYHRVFNVRGLRTTAAYTLEVEKVFVELHIAPAYLKKRR
jgi:hypothetical protein